MSSLGSRRGSRPSCVFRATVSIAEDEGPGHHGIVEITRAHARVLTHPPRSGNFTARARPDRCILTLVAYVLLSRTSMKIRVLGAFGSEGLGHRPSAFLVDEKVLIDGGTRDAPPSPSPSSSRSNTPSSPTPTWITSAGLVYLAETLAICGVGRAVTIAGVGPVDGPRSGAGCSTTVLAGLRDRPTRRACRSSGTRSWGRSVEQRVGDLWVTPIAVSHTVPTAGFIVHDGSTGVDLLRRHGPDQGALADCP